MAQLLLDSECRSCRLGKTAPVPGFESLSRTELFHQVAGLDRKLGVLSKLQGFAVAANHITTDRGQGAYHLIVLNPVSRTLRITPYPVARLEQANLDYAEVEQSSKDGEAIEAVLVSAGPVDALRKAYPNYFLDTQAFVAHMQRVIGEVQGPTASRALQRTGRKVSRR